MIRIFTCVICPNGCEITAVLKDGIISSIQNATCKRGEEYVRCELTNPMRSIASLAAVENGDLPLVSVRTNRPIPKSGISAVMGEIRKIRLKAPVSIGTVVIKNICGFDSDVIITKNIELFPKRKPSV
jgi:CxxC motif-containing protein